MSVFTPTRTPAPAVVHYVAKRYNLDTLEAEGMATVWHALTFDSGTTIEQVILETGFTPTYVRETMSRMYRYGDVDVVDDNGGWMLLRAQPSA